MMECWSVGVLEYSIIAGDMNESSLFISVGTKVPTALEENSRLHLKKVPTALAVF